MTARKCGITESLERLSRIDAPEKPWKFSHLGEPGASAESLLQEAIWRAIGLSAGRLVLSLGSHEANRDDFDPDTTAASIGKCLDLLADKGPKELWLALPTPCLWPLERREGVERLRQKLSNVRPRWGVVDLEPAARRFMEAQSAHPDLVAALVEDSPNGPVPTATGALLLAREIHRAWTP